MFVTLNQSLAKILYSAWRDSIEPQFDLKSTNRLTGLDWIFRYPIEPQLVPNTNPYK